MGESACLMHGFSYASAIPNESKQGNPIHVLGESISFGRFMTESLSWDRWSTFSHKKYVEEAERYAQPGSVAQKKAFFEAHYKRIAAQKAAALLEQEKDAKGEVEGDSENNDNDDKERVTLNSQVEVDEKVEEFKIQDETEEHSSNVVVEKVSKEEENEVITRNEGLEVSPLSPNSNNQVNNVENQETISGSDGSGTPQMERPLLKDSVASEEIPSVTSKKKSGLSSLKSSIQRKTWKIPSTPAAKKENNAHQSTRKSNADMTGSTRSSPKSLRELINLVPIKEPDKEPVSAAKKTTSTSRILKDCKTPLRTPNVTATKGASKYGAATPISENRRMRTPMDSAATGSKASGPKWHILSAVRNKSMTAWNKLQSPTLSTPFTLRTEERAAKRKQKLEEKFNANEKKDKMQIQKTLKEKAGNEYKKLSCGFCFKARPLPEFYKERETSINLMKKTPTPRPQTAVLGRSISNKKQGNISMPPPPPPLTSFAKSGAFKNLSKKNVGKSSKFLASSLPERITHENKSPNIQL